MIAEDHNIPVITTFMAKGAISDQSEMALGVVGLGFKDYVVEAINDSDLIISVGFDFAEHSPRLWYTERNKTIIHIDSSIAETSREYQPEIQLIGNIRLTLHHLFADLQSYHPELWHLEYSKRIKDSIKSYNTYSDQDTFNVPRTIQAVRSVLPDQGILISDVGTHKMWIARNYPTYLPNTCIISNGLATMGIALPGLIGANIACPDSPVVAMMGDGGALMNIQELETAKRLGCKGIYIVLNDNNYGLIEWKQERNTGSSFGTRLSNPNFIQLAQSFGINGYKPETFSELIEIMQYAIEREDLILIELPISTQVNQDLIDELNHYYQ
jgi:acetolactate synthase-1/2/3 large subunit